MKVVPSSLRIRRCPCAPRLSPSAAPKSRLLADAPRDRAGRVTHLRAQEAAAERGAVLVRAAVGRAGAVRPRVLAEVPGVAVGVRRAREPLPRAAVGRDAIGAADG